MDLEIPKTVLKLIKGKVKSDVLAEATKGDCWRGWESVDHHDLHTDEYDILLDAAENAAPKGMLGKDAKKARGLAIKCRALINIRDGKEKGYTNLNLLAEAMRVWCREHLPHGWVFSNDKYTNEAMPYLITNIQYHPPQWNGGYYHPAFVQIQGKAIRRGDHIDTSKQLERSDFTTPVGPDTALALMGMLPENAELVQSYKDSLEKHGHFRQKFGIQMVSTGMAKADAEESRWWVSEKSMALDGKGGKAGRVILDDDEGWKADKSFIHHDDDLHPAKLKEKLDDDESVENTTKVVKLPEHPYLRVFDLYTHSFCETHVDNVDEYIYDRRAFDRVVLPDDTKTMIDAMVNSKCEGDDIVAGKGKGVIILSSGPPGTGKTLTAEAYTERSKKPLYSVQCSQLGLDPEGIEKELGTFLARCKKWGAIGLIDEADVFIRERGDDLTQNAIVGVFLRVLEYYEGVLFMTTNRRGLVDDAVLSRCIIHVKYQVPDLRSSEQIWNIMLAQFKLGEWSENQDEPEARGSLRLRLANKFLGSSGRTIKNLCRVAKAMTEQGMPLNLETFDFVAQFQDVEAQVKRRERKELIDQ